jgi:hypothetical protein
MQRMNNRLNIVDWAETRCSIMKQDELLIKVKLPLCLSIKPLKCKGKRGNSF